MFLQLLCTEKLLLMPKIMIFPMLTHVQENSEREWNRKPQLLMREPSYALCNYLDQDS